jgi:NitT/TauT family transport system substrate-binding protein
MKCLWFSFLFFLIATVYAAPETALKKVVFSPQWMPQAQFAGYYMAKEKGFYKALGLDVEFLHATPDKSASSYLKEGKADFITLFLASAIKQKAKGFPLVNIAQLSQHSGLVFVAKKRSGIKTIADLNNKRLGLWRSDFQTIPRAFIRQNKLSMNIVPISSGVNLFLLDGVDVVTTMWYNEYHEILNKGVDKDELTTFFFSKHELDIPEDGIYCLQGLRKREPELCHKFVKASIQGWKYAFKHPDESIKIVRAKMKEVHLPNNYAHQRWMLDRIKDLISTKGQVIPGLSENVYDKTVDILKKEHVLSVSPAYKTFYQPVLKNDKK